MVEKFKIIIFGASVTAYKILNFLDTNTTDIICFIDNLKSSNNEMFENKNVLLPEKVEDLIYDYIIIASSSKYRMMTEQLLNLSVNKNNIIQAYNYTGVLPTTFFYNDEIVKDLNYKKLFTDVSAFHRGYFG